MAPINETRKDEIIKVFNLVGPRLPKKDLIGKMMIQYGKILARLMRGDDVRADMEILDKLDKIREKILNAKDS